MDLEKLRVDELLRPPSVGLNGLNFGKADSYGGSYHQSAIIKPLDFPIPLINNKFMIPVFDQRDKALKKWIISSWMLQKLYDACNHDDTYLKEHFNVIKETASGVMPKYNITICKSKYCYPKHDKSYFVSGREICSHCREKI